MKCCSGINPAPFCDTSVDPVLSCVIRNILFIKRVTIRFF